MAATTLALTRSQGVTLGRRRVYIFPTRQGGAFAAVLLVMLLGSINYNNGLGYLLTFLLTAAGMVCMLHTWRNLAGLHVYAGRVRPVFAGGSAAFRVEIENGAAHARPALLLRGTGVGPLRCTHAYVGPHATVGVRLAVAAPRRGWLPIGRITIATRYPLGLFRAWAPVELEARCLVYPRPAGDRPLPHTGAGNASEHGTGGEDGDDFAGFRDYHPGDSPRHIHWKAVARDQGIPVKLFEGAAAGDVVLRYAHTPGAEREARLSQLCRWVLDAERAGHRYGLELPGLRIAPGDGERHRARCLEALALHGLDDGAQV